MAKRVGVDKWMFGTTILLVLFGLVMVFSASAVMAKATTGTPYTYVTKQAAFAVAGVIALFALMRVDYRRYNNKAVIIALMVVTGLLLVGVFAMSGMNGAHRWIRFSGTTLQPSELAKPAIVLFLAWFLQTRIHAIDNIKDTIVPAVIPPLVYILLILKEPDLGTALVCAGVVMLMLILAGMRMRWIGLAGAAAAPVLYYMLFHVAFRAARMKA